MGCVGPWASVGRWVNDVPSGRDIRDAHWMMQSPSIHSSPLPNKPNNTTPLMSSSTFFKNNENTEQFWKGASSGLVLQSPGQECHPSTHLVFARLDTPTPTGPTCRGVPQTCCPQCCAPINNNSTQKDITIWNNQKHTHQHNSEDATFCHL